MILKESEVDTLRCFADEVSAIGKALEPDTLDSPSGKLKELAGKIHGLIAHAQNLSYKDGGIVAVKYVPTPEERAINRALAREVVKRIYPGVKMADEVMDEDPICMWLEALLHDVRLGKR